MIIWYDAKDIFVIRVKFSIFDKDFWKKRFTILYVNNLVYRFNFNIKFCLKKFGLSFIISIHNDEFNEKSDKFSRKYALPLSGINIEITLLFLTISISFFKDEKYCIARR